MSITEDLLLHAGMKKSVCYGPCVSKLTPESFYPHVWPPSILGVIVILEWNKDWSRLSFRIQSTKKHYLCRNMWVISSTNPSKRCFVIFSC